jgi:ATP adenylyltransferase
MQYVRKLVRSKGCVFCVAAAGGVGVDHLLLYKSAHSMIMLNKFPYNSGHILVLPLRHCGDLLGLSGEEFTDLHQTLKMAAALVQKTYAPGGVNIGMNHGACAGAGIPDHLHYHLIPRWTGDTNFFPLIAQTKVTVETVEQSYERLEAQLKLGEVE